MAEKYFDILLTDDDLTLDAGGIPERCSDRDSIAQDLVNMIRDTGLLVDMVGDRDPMAKAANLVKLSLEVDEDERIVPGTCRITEAGLGVFYLQAETVEYGPIYTTMEIA